MIAKKENISSKTFTRMVYTLTIYLHYELTKTLTDFLQTSPEVFLYYPPAGKKSLGESDNFENFMGRLQHPTVGAYSDI